MILEKVVFILSILVLISLLGRKLIKKHCLKNILVITVLTISLGIYLPFVVFNKNIPFAIQLGILFVGIIFPLIYTVIQYNDINLTRKILYHNMKNNLKYKNYEKAMEIINKLILIDGVTSEYSYIQGLCYKESNELVSAEECFKEAIKIDRYNFKAVFEVGQIFERFSQKKEAVEYYIRAIRIKPDYYEAYEALAINLTRQGKFDLAINIYKRATVIFPKSFELMYNLAMLECEVGDRDNAYIYFEKVLEIKPDLYTANYTLGVLYMEKKEYEKAIEQFKIILNNSVYGARAYYKLAITYMLMEDYERAMSALEYVMELEPQYITEVDREYTFNPIRDRINNYKIQKEKSRIKNYTKRNFFDKTFKLLKIDNEDEKLEEKNKDEKYEEDITKKDNKEEKIQNNA